MKIKNYYYILFFVICLSCNNIFDSPRCKNRPNFILTGDSVSECISHINITDIFLDATDSEQAYDTLSIDVNMDGELDLRLEAYSSNGRGMGYYSTSIIPLKNTSIHMSLKDTINKQYPNIVEQLDSNIRVDENLTYSTEEAYFRIHDWSLNDIPPYGIDHYYSGHKWEGDKYIGLKINTLNDTIYSWVRLKCDKKTIELLEYAYR